MRNFKQLLIWQKGIVIAQKTYELVGTFPKDDRYGLSKQLTRAAVSIASNIAEGSSRSSPKEYNRYLEIALGSAFEAETQLVIGEAANFGEKDRITYLLKEVDEEQKMIMSFMKKLT